MNELYIYENMLKLIRERRESIVQHLCYDKIEDFCAFKEQRAKLFELATLEQELKLLLEKVTKDESDST